MQGVQFPGTALVTGALKIQIDFDGVWQPINRGVFCIIAYRDQEANTILKPWDLSNHKMLVQVNVYDF